MNDALRSRLAAVTGSAVTGINALHGGDVAAVWRLRLSDGRVLVAKQGSALLTEAWMLGYLRAHSRLPVPGIVHAEDDLLVIEFVENDGGLDAAAETHLADLVAGMHDIEGTMFGLERDTLIGGLPQPNRQSDDWLAFFRDERLLHMGASAQAAGRLPSALMRRVERLAGSLSTWLKNDTAPALIHGDLWGGNVLVRNGMVVALIDPAIYFADPEIELAFMTLFNTAGKAFFTRYNEHRPLRPGFFEERRDLYNLYPLLVHVRLFGGPYVAKVERTLTRYGC